MSQIAVSRDTLVRDFGHDPELLAEHSGSDADPKDHERRSVVVSHVLERSQRLPAPPEAVFPFFADALNLERITPAWLGFRVRTPGPIVMAAGTLIEYRLKLHGVPINWLTRIETWEPPHRFVDVQIRGPYKLWHHTHSFEPAPDGTLMRDTVRYALPFGPLGELARRAFVERDLRRIFDFRQTAVQGMIR
jgi:ligand-binding SRPBCC domain-containing protein